MALSVLKWLQVASSWIKLDQVASSGFCSGIAWDARASDALIVENDEPKDDLALLVGIERLDNSSIFITSSTSAQ